MPQMNGASLLVDCLEKHEVELIFGIPGTKIDSVFEVLRKERSKIRLVVCRHEQNAAFMAAMYGRLTGKPGVVLVTSGPGVTNLATGLLTATTEGDPVIALAANVSRVMHARHTHQSLNNVLAMKPVTKQSIEVLSPENIPEVISGAFRIATEGHRGAVFISFPQDVLLEQTSVQACAREVDIEFSAAPENLIMEAAKLINNAKFPVLLLGQDSTYLKTTEAIRNLLKQSSLPTVGTFQSAGVISRDLVHCFMGRVGLFANQPGDKALSEADVVICIGYDPVEYDTENWNKDFTKRKIVHIDVEPAQIRNTYVPKIELLGDIAKTIHTLTKHVNIVHESENKKKVLQLQKTLLERIESGKNKNGKLIHPLRFIYELNRCIDDETILMSDIGTHYIWLARYLFSYEPRHLLFSNGQQTLGIALPWATATSMVYPNKKIISVSGDGGFLFSSMELETAVREKCHFVHFVWTDGEYNMVAEQQKTKYEDTYGVKFNSIDIVKYAERFGAKGYRIDNADNIYATLKNALQQEVPVIIDIPIDYSENAELFSLIHKNDTGN